jgi:predicted nucleotidyltransferase
MGVFGSYANGTQSQESDIDILLTPKQQTIFSYKKKIGLEKFLVELLNIEKIDLVNIRYLNPVIKNSAEKNIIYV